MFYGSKLKLAICRILLPTTISNKSSKSAATLRSAPSWSNILIRSVLRMLKYWYLSEWNVLQMTLPNTSVKTACQLLLSMVTKNSEFHLIFGISLLNTFTDVNGFLMTHLITKYVVCISLCLLLTAIILDLCKMLPIPIPHQAAHQRQLMLWVIGQVGLVCQERLLLQLSRLDYEFVSLMFCIVMVVIELSWFTILYHNIWCSCWLTILTSFIS